MTSELLEIYPSLETPVSDNAPCGENLEYSAEFMELETLAQSTPEQQFGNTIIAGEEPDWREIYKSSQKLLKKSWDLRIAVRLLRASIEQNGIDSLPVGLEFVAGLLDRYWEHLYPELEDDDYTFRINALSDLREAAAIPKSLRKSIILSVRGFTDISLGDIEKVCNHKHDTLTQNDLIPRFADASETCTRLNKIISRSIEACEKIDRILLEKTNEGSQFSEVICKLLSNIRLYLPQAQHIESSEESFSDPVQTTESQPNTMQAAPQHGIHSRQDISRLIDEMCIFLESHEPGNPAPLFLRRAQKLLGMDFFSIIKELNPDGIQSISHLAGVTPE